MTGLDPQKEGWSGSSEGVLRGWVGGVILEQGMIPGWVGSGGWRNLSSNRIVREYQEKKVMLPCTTTAETERGKPGVEHTLRGPS